MITSFFFRNFVTEQNRIPMWNFDNLPTAGQFDQKLRWQPCIELWEVESDNSCLIQVLLRRELEMLMLGEYRMMKRSV
uniref:Uncharacterized protein n=1 Tax=Salix viminalis TaxID=40686 RepID=A0A6N2KU04_SALVM